MQMIKFILIVCNEKKLKKFQTDSETIIIEIVRF